MIDTLFTPFSWARRDRGGARPSLVSANLLSLAWRAKRLLKVRKSAAALGARNQPPATSQEPCAAEREIALYFQDHAQYEQQRRIGEMNQITAAAGAIDLHDADHHFTDEINDARDAAREVEADALAKIVPLKEERDEHERQLQQFCAKHELSETFPYGRSLILWFAVLFFCAVSEAAPNAAFLGEGDELGILGGWMVALSFGLANVGVGVLLAFGKRNLIPNSWTSKAKGIVQVAAASAIAFAFNLIAAHYRAALTGDPVNAMQIMAETLADSPLTPQIDVKSVGLFTMSAFAAAIAYWKTIGTWGEFPGYRARALPLLRANEGLRNAIDDARRDIDAARADAHAGIAEKVDEARDRDARAGRLLADARTVAERYGVAARGISEAYTATVTFFREINRSVRTAPPPAYFANLVFLNIAPLDVPQSVIDKHAETEQALALVEERAIDGREEVDALIDTALRRIDAELSNSEEDTQ